MKKRNVYSTVLVLALSFMMLTNNATAQNIGINPTGAAPDAGAILDVSASDKGVLIPRVNIDNLGTIAPITGSSTVGMLVYNTNATTGQGYHYWDGSRWVKLSTDGEAWKTTGNAWTNTTNNFLGTTNNVDLRIRTNNTNRFEFSTNGAIRSFGTGSAGVPSYSWTENTNMGMYRIESGILGFSTNGTERMRINANGNIGIGTTNPLQRLHINGGNLSLDGAFMPGNNAGTADQILLSNGVNNAPIWSNFTFLNNSQTNALGKYYSGTFNIDDYTVLTLTLSDPNCVPTSTCSFSWVGPLPSLGTGYNYAQDLIVNIQATTGAWIFTIANTTGQNLSNLQFSYFAAY